MPNLVIAATAKAYSDKVTTNAPLRQNFNWTRNATISVDDPRSDEKTIAVGDSWAAFSGTLSTSIDGTSAFTVTNPFTAIYRFTHVAGTAPAFRTDRGLALNGRALTIGVNTDSTALFTLGTGNWGTVAAGDTVFLPGPVTGDVATVFNVLNQGSWVVLAVLSSNVLQVTRSTGDFQGSSEAVTLTSDDQVVAYSAAGVQIGDQVRITAGFAVASRRTYVVSAVTPDWFEVSTTESVPLEASKIPGAAGMVFYRDAARYLRIEALQEVAIRLNGSTDDLIQLSPVQADDEDQAAWFEVWCPVWSLTIVNKSAVPATVRYFSAE